MSTMKKLRLPTLIAFFALTTAAAFSQCDSTAYYANKYLGAKYIPDGQSYRALIFDDQVAEFHTTFYGNARYRIVGFSGMEKEQLVFSLYDEQDNLLFTNESHQNNAYWDFDFESTMVGRIEAQLDLLKQTSGCAVILIGFER